MAEQEAAAASLELSPAAESEAPLETATEAAPSDPAPVAPEEAAPPSEAAPAAADPEPAVETDAPQEAEDATAAAPEETPAAASDNKRKLEDLEQPGEAPPEEKQDDPIPHIAEETDQGEAKPEAEEKATEAAADAAAPAKRQRLDGETDGSAIAGDQEMENSEAPAVANRQPPSADNEQHVPADNTQTPNVSFPQQEDSQSIMTSRRFEVANNKVGVLIGKAGETIRVLQQNSGAKIQITRDREADPNSTSRPVELTGTLENINKAEQLIKDVIAEAEAGGSPALVARGLGNGQSGTEQHEIQVPNEKVGWIIGKGGETIKNLQTRSGARIQLIPQHLPDGDSPKERIVRVTGNKKQIEVAKEMIKDVMIQAPLKHASHSGGYNQQSFRPRGPNSHSQWGTRPTPTQPAAGYGYQQRGMYPQQSTQYPPQQAPPRSSSSTGWDQRAPAPVQIGGYNYYGQGIQAANNQSIPAAAPSPAPVNYNHGPSQAAGYGQQTPYFQSTPTQQNYSQGYNEQKYDNQAPAQQYYGQQPMNSQAGAYQQQGGAQADYAQQQPYIKPAYEGAPQSYGPPRASQPGDPMYQGGVPSSYGSGGPTQQSYPYGQSAPTQQATAYGQAYGPTTGTTDGYTQPSSATGYPQQSSQVTPGYAQGGQPAPAYTQQGVQSGGYVQYPQQQSYADQSVPNNMNYGYQGGPAEAGCAGSNIPNSGYGSAPVTNQVGYGQTGYPQPQAYPSGYEQSMQPQPGYGSHPGSAPAGYTKGLSPQPGYGGQYYSG